ncbi:hypothetical protein ACFWFR_00145 [Oerskovia sp. NPDC060287]|uniref:hypothetical protein n=1 Tax=Oerskovia sp. NPDC060287 TaxID=3347095 RepID=UPI003660BD8B
MTSRLLSRAAARTEVMRRLDGQFKALGMKRLSGTPSGWVKSNDQGRGAAVWLRFETVGRMYLLIDGGEMRKATCVGAEGGYGPVGWEMYNIATTVYKTTMLHDVLSAPGRELLRESAARFVQPLANRSADPYLDDSRFLEWRLTNRDAFFPLPDLDYVDQWCEIVAPGLLDIAREQISRL